jgi:hypothetical protein
VTDDDMAAAAQLHLVETTERDILGGEGGRRRQASGGKGDSDAHEGSS